MSKPFLSQIVNLCKEQNMHQMYVVEGHESKLVVTDEVLTRYPDVEIDALTIETISTVDYKRSPVFLQMFKVFI